MADGAAEGLNGIDRKLFDLLNARQKVGSMTPVVYGAPGLSEQDVSTIEEQLGFRLPPDLVDLFQNLQDPGGVFFPWAKFEKRQYDESIARVLEGIEFDVKSNYVWLDRWGEKPQELSDALAIVREDFKTWPKLLPLHGHRFLAAEPCLSGNPNSIVQTDIIYYGADLGHYLMLEFIDNNERDLYLRHTYDQPIRAIDIWADLTS